MTASSGSTPFTYPWNTSPVQNTQVATGLCAGTYSVLVTDGSAATSTATVVITQPTALTSTMTPASVSCGSGGAASVSASGGTGAYSYLWNPGGITTSSVSGLSSGNYMATVTDANGCTSTQTITINTALNSGTVSVTSQAILCNGSDATINATISGGASPFTYSWSGGQTTSSVNVPAGNYVVTVTDGNGCVATQSLAITEPAAITSSVTVVGTNCGTSIGSADVTASGGTGTLSYNWNPGGQTVPNISNLAAGTYSCTITDANGCTQVQFAVVNNLNGPTVNISAQTNNICNGGLAGAATATVTGGTGPYTYSWNTTPLQAAATATGLASGQYAVIVTDATGCTNSQTVTITEPAAMTASITVTPAACGVNDGTANAIPAGGTSPYSYLWTTAESTQTISGLSAGNYSVTVTDVNGCSQTFSATVINSNGPTAVAGTSTTIMPGSLARLRLRAE